MSAFLERRFALAERRTDVRTEALGGIGFGVLGFVTVMLVKGRARDVHPIMWALVPLFLAFYAEDWLSANVF